MRNYREVRNGRALWGKRRKRNPTTVKRLEIGRKALPWVDPISLYAKGSRLPEPREGRKGEELAKKRTHEGYFGRKKGTDFYRNSFKGGCSAAYAGYLERG